ncbi:MAG: S66 peptidase family protein [Acidobacteriaceae bacterium]
MKKSHSVGSRKSRIIRPNALRPGDTVGIVAPASNIDEKALRLGTKNLQRLGYEPVFLNSILSREIYFAGTAERRAAELEAMFDSDDLRAVLCARGGYGSNHVLPLLDIRKFKRKPKIFVGYSDITSLLTWFVDNGMVAFHGPMVTKDFAHLGGWDEDAWEAVLEGQGCVMEFGQGSAVEALVPGEAKGVLYGGCLSILVASLGTPYEIQTDGKLLFIEDIGAKPYQVDRMLMQLKLAAKLRRVRGIVFGEMLDCVQPGGQDYSLKEIIVRLLSDLKIPIAFGFPSGHVRSGNVVLPFGVSATLEVSRKSIRFSMEPATVA